jgi:hypothetical protein
MQPLTGLAVILQLILDMPVRKNALLSTWRAIEGMWRRPVFFLIGELT